MFDEILDRIEGSAIEAARALPPPARWGTIE